MSVTDTAPTTPYASATLQVIAGLMSSVTLLRAGHPDEALPVLRGMHASVLALHAAAADFRAAASREATMAETQLEGLERSIGETYDQEKQVEAQIRKTEELITGERASAEGLARAEARLRQELEGLQRKMDELRRRAEEFRTWFWVPGYGQYLAIRTLADQDIQRYRSTQQELTRLREELARDNLHAHRLQEMLAHLSRTSAELQARDAELERVRAELEQRKRDAARRVTGLLDVELFYASLQGRLGEIDRRIDDVEEMLSVLQAMQEEVGRLNRELTEFAAEVDGHPLTPAA